VPVKIGHRQGCAVAAVGPGGLERAVAVAEEDVEAGHKVEPAVAVEISYPQAAAPGGEVAGRLEGAVALAPKGTHTADRQIRKAIAVEIPDHNRIWPREHRIPGRGLEGAVAVAQQDTHVGAVVVDHDKVEEAVGVDVPHRHGTGSGHSREVAGWQKRAVTVAQQQANAANSLMGGSEIDQAVAVEVPDRDGPRQEPLGNRTTGLEGAVAPAWKNPHAFFDDPTLTRLFITLALVSSCRQVEEAIGIEVPDRDGSGYVTHVGDPGRLESAVPISQETWHGP